MFRTTAFLLMLGIVASTAFAQYDQYGGWTKLKGKKTGFFHTQQIAGRWWFVSPEGNAFYVKGVETVRFGRLDAPSPVGEEKAKAQKTVLNQFKKWNFNAVGLWSEQIPGLPYFANLEFAENFVPNMWLLGIVSDYFSPEFRKSVDERAARMCSEMAKDPWLIGYFTDNEIRWKPDIRSRDSVLDAFLKKDPQSAGYKRAMAFLKERGHTPETMTPEDKAAFIEVAAAQYGRVVKEAIRKYDKNHLILGSRFNSAAPQLNRALAPYYDVFSLNCYDEKAPVEKLREINSITGKPTMITEFSFKAMDSGLPNTIGAGDPVPTQQDRANLFASYVHELAGLPFNIGHEWYRYRDQPKEGEGDSSPGGLGGENGNYGLVTIDGKPYDVLVNHMTDINGGIEEYALKALK